MNRNRWLLPVTLSLLVLGVVYHIWANWGLVTVHANNELLSTVIRKIEKQGNVTIKTDLPLDTKVYMNVDKVVVTEALETLATVTDSRWRLAFFVAGDKASVNSAVASVTAKQRPEGWKVHFSQPLQFSDQPDTPLDPRQFIWTVSTPAEPTMQAYLAAASNQVSAMVYYPEGWNPPVTKAPKSGPIVKSLPKLVDSAKGQSQTMFLLQGDNNNRQAWGGGEGGGPRPDGPPQTDGSGGGGRRGANAGGGGGRRGPDPAVLEERMKAQLAQLPPQLRAKAEAEIKEQMAFMQSMADLTPEQRRAKAEEMASDSSRQEKMDARMAAAEARRSPEQRIKSSKKYIERKAEMQNASGTATTGPGAGGGGGAPARP